MKREILFRGKRTDNGEWIYGWLVEDVESNIYAIISYVNLNGNIHDLSECQIFEVIPETVGQFTGLYDKNAVKIFEGDIITNRYFESGRVYYEDGAFEVSENGLIGTFNENFDGDICEVIGNIYDNPELMERS